MIRYSEEEFNATHGGLGGDPWGGIIREECQRQETGLVLRQQTHGCAIEPESLGYGSMQIKRCYSSLIMKAVAILFLFFLVGCEDSKLRFLVCPHKLANQVESQNDLAEKREVLFRADEYSLLVVKNEHAERVSPVQHYRPKHTYSDETLPLNASWEDPLHISTIVIIEETPKIGIAIKIDKENDWRVYWVGAGELDKVMNSGVLYLPPYSELPVLNAGSFSE
jgi:hypothetical protein